MSLTDGVDYNLTGATVGYDLDGTICVSGPKREKPYFKQTGEERRAHEELLKEHYKSAEIFLRPSQLQFYIITARKEKYRKETNFLLEENSIRPMQLFMLPNKTPRTREQMIIFKAYWIERLCLKMYYEDDKKIAKALSEKCRLTMIVYVGK